MFFMFYVFLISICRCVADRFVTEDTLFRLLDELIDHVLMNPFGLADIVKLQM